MKNLLILMLLGIVSYAHADPLNGTICKGKKYYWEEISHVGGAGPGPNGLMSHTELRISGKSVEHIDNYVNDDSPQVDPIYTVSFDEDTRKEISKTGSSETGSETYQIFLLIEKSDHTDVIPGKVKVRTKVLCKKNWAMLP
jgi:hypothetical protein